jgi:hypothetical protein
LLRGGMRTLSAVAKVVSLVGSPPTGLLEKTPPSHPAPPVDTHALLRQAQLAVVRAWGGDAVETCSHMFRSARRAGLLALPPWRGCRCGSPSTWGRKTTSRGQTQHIGDTNMRRVLQVTMVVVAGTHHAVNRAPSLASLSRLGEDMVGCPSTDRSPTPISSAAIPAMRVG